MNYKIFLIITPLFFSTLFFSTEHPTPKIKTKLTPVSKGWASNSINAVIFRSNSITSFNNYQFTAFYDSTGNVILAKRELNSEKWEIKKTQYKGDVKDAHKCISIIIDGEGYLHMAWDQHNNKLRYCRSTAPFELELTSEMQMTGIKEESVSYPQFFRMPDGNLIFMYRDGSSGSGNLVVNFYDIKKKSWTNLHQNLIDGESKRNAYWQAAVDTKGTIHISWVWRETWDVATNHDMCYAKSTDNGKTWIKSNGEKYSLPINSSSAEYVAEIPQSHELINQTSMCTDENGNPYIASYWTPEGSDIPQYHLIYFDGREWHTNTISNRKTPFSLSGGGTKKIPISRPQILADKNGSLFLIFRDEERGSRISILTCSDLKKNIWKAEDLTPFGVGNWEPGYDTDYWKAKNVLNLFVQKVGQGDAETLEKITPQTVYILEMVPVS